MARISEIETENHDRIEVALTQAEHAALAAPGSGISYRISLYHADGRTIDGPGDLRVLGPGAGWAHDSDTLEWVAHVELNMHQFNANFANPPKNTPTRYQVVGLSRHENGLVHGEHYLGIGVTGGDGFAAAPVDGVMAGTGVILEYYEFDDLPRNLTGAGEFSLRWDAPDITAPFLGDASIGESGTAPVCFARGTRIATPKGARRVETLRGGEIVTCLTGPRRLEMLTRQRKSGAQLARVPRFGAVRIRAGSLGAGLPLRDLILSRQHRVLVRSAIVKRVTGVPEALVAAHRLVGLDGIEAHAPEAGIEYWHLVFCRHEVVLAEGAPCESLFAGPLVLRTMPPRVCEALLAGLAEAGGGFGLGTRAGSAEGAPVPAFPIPPGPVQREIVRRHLRNRKPLISGDVHDAQRPMAAAGARGARARAVALVAPGRGC